MSATAAGELPLRLNPRLDVELIARVYRAAGRVHVPDLFDPPSAARIFRALESETPWQCVLFDGSDCREFPVASFADLPDDERARLFAQSDAAAGQGFSYRYSNFRLFENWQEGLHREVFLMRVLEFLNSPPFLALTRRITGDALIAYADAQATQYRPGDFLTCHDDGVEGKHRRAAYVLSFTPAWHADWGGLLAFPDGHGHVAEAYAPAFNALNLFRVPMLHAVTQVSSFAAAPRYSITGWMRQLPPSA